MKKLGSILLALLILLPCLPVVRAEGMTIEVGDGETYTTISALLSDPNAGLSGDVTIQLTSDITDAITIDNLPTGVNSLTIDGGDNRYTIKGATGGEGNEKTALTTSVNLTLRNLTLTSRELALGLQGDANLTIEGECVLEGDGGFTPVSILGENTITVGAGHSLKIGSTSSALYVGWNATLTLEGAGTVAIEANHFVISGSDNTFQSNFTGKLTLSGEGADDYAAIAWITLNFVAAPSEFNLTGKIIGTTITGSKTDLDVIDLIEKLEAHQTGGRTEPLNRENQEKETYPPYSGRFQLVFPQAGGVEYWAEPPVEQGAAATPDQPTGDKQNPSMGGAR